MKYKTEENNMAIEESLQDFESMQNENVFHLSKMKEWCSLYLGLHSICLRDRYFNSCVPDFPCVCTNENIEYEFSMFYYTIQDLVKWIELNDIYKDYYVQILSSEPGSEDEEYLMTILSTDFGNALSYIGELESSDNGISLKCNIEHLNFGEINVDKSEIKGLIELSSLYYNWLWVN